MTLELDTDERQVIPRPGTRSTDFLLMLGDTVKAIGRYVHATRVLEKRHDPDHHAHRRRRGTGVNLELVALLDHQRPAPARLELVNPGGARRSLAWPALRRYAEAALAGDDRFLLAEHADRQVLVPFAAFNGLIGPAGDVKLYPDGWAPEGHDWSAAPPPANPAVTTARTVTPAPPPPPSLFDIEEP